jgi:hypothetical protein
LLQQRRSFIVAAGRRHRRVRRYDAATVAEGALAPLAREDDRVGVAGGDVTTEDVAILGDRRRASVPVAGVGEAEESNVLRVAGLKQRQSVIKPQNLFVPPYSSSSHGFFDISLILALSIPS